MKGKRLARGINVRLFEKPPRDFSPLDAKARDLRKYGFPRFPEHPQLREHY